MANLLNLSKEALIIQHHSAFSLYLDKGMEEVVKYHPESVDFVKENSDKTLKEITDILTKELNELNNDTIRDEVPSPAVPVFS